MEVVPMDHETGQTQTQTDGAGAQEGPRSFQQDALNRVRAFTGGIMIMACPVLLAIVVNQVNPKTESHRLVVGIISMAALTLEAGVFPFLSLCLSNGTADLWPDISAYLFVASKLLVYLCAILLMALAFGILLLISMDYLLAYMCLVIVFVVFTLLLCYLSFQNSPATATTDQTSTSESDGDRQKQVATMLENLVEFSVAGTSILFLGLEGLALARLSRNTAATPATPTTTPELDQVPLKASLGVSFFTCLLGVFVMLPGVVPVPALMTSAGNGDRATTKTKFVVEILNIALAIFIVATVILITAAAVKTILLAWLVLVPAIVSFLLWMFIETFCGKSMGLDVKKPASLDLTKVTFTGFLAVSVMAIGNGIGNHHQPIISFYEQAFVVLTAAAVVTGIGWRLLTHRTGQSLAVVVAATVASFCAHACVALAVVPFAVMAFERGAAGASAGAPGPAATH